MAAPLSFVSCRTLLSNHAYHWANDTPRPSFPQALMWVAEDPALVTEAQRPAFLDMLLLCTLTKPLYNTALMQDVTARLAGSLPGGWVNAGLWQWSISEHSTSGHPCIHVKQGQAPARPSLMH
jgi:hypothetical protein